jgi:hypothetical protein
MSLTGTIADVPLADVIQMLFLARRSGSLKVRHGSSLTALSFADGRLTNATSPSAQRPEELLVRLGILPNNRLEEARDLQRQSPVPATVEAILIERGFARQETLDRAAEKCITEVIGELLSLQRGSYEFANDDPWSSSDPAPRLFLDTEKVLAEARKRNRDPSDTAEILRLDIARTSSHREPSAAGQQRYDSPPPAEPENDQRRQAGPAAAQNGNDLTLSTPEQTWIAEKTRKVDTRLEVITRDKRFLSDLEACLVEHAEVVPTRLEESLEYSGTDVAPIVLVDLRDEGLSERDVAALDSQRPAVPIMVVTDPDAPRWSFFQAGASSVLPANPETIRSCLQTISRSLAPRLSRRSINLRTESLRILRESLDELPGRRLFSTVTLNLLHIFPNLAERAVFFLVRRRELELEALGAFGTNDSGESLKDVMRGLRIPLCEESPLSAAVLDGLVRLTSIEDDPFHHGFLSLLGAPRGPMTAILPVFGANRIIAVVYLDSNQTTSENFDVDSLELAAVQLGLTLENEFLLRRMA